MSGIAAVVGAVAAVVAAVTATTTTAVGMSKKKQAEGAQTALAANSMYTAQGDDIVAMSTEALKSQEAEEQAALEQLMSGQALV